MKSSGNAFFQFLQMLCVCVIILIGVLVVQHPVAESTDANVLFILDGSGSMWGRLEGDVEKIVIAKERMTELVQELEGINMGLIVYGHRRKGDCDDIEMMVSLGSGNKDAVIQQIQSISPKGKTPIKRSIALAAQHLETLEEETEIVLVSDGLETCDDDPCGYVQNLKKKGIKFTMDVVGFDVNKEEREQLACIAKAGGGRYFSAQNAMQLKEAFMEVKTEVVKKVEASSAKKTRDEKPAAITVSVPVGLLQETVKAVAKRYMSVYPNRTIRIISGPNSPDTACPSIKTQAVKADIYLLDSVCLGVLADQFIDLDNYGVRGMFTGHSSDIIQHSTVNGRLIGIPWTEDFGLLYYRTDLLRKYGYTKPPQTWVELTEMARVIQSGERAKGNRNFWGFVWQGDNYEGLTCDALEWIASHGGGTIISLDKKITVNNAKAVEALHQAASWVGDISPRDVVNFREEDVRHIWQAGNAAFMRNWPYCYPLGSDANSPIKNKFGIAPLPASKSGSSVATLGAREFAISKYSKYPDIAADFSLFSVSKREQLKLIELYFLPAVMSLYQNLGVQGASPLFIDLQSHVINFVTHVARPSSVTGENYFKTSELVSTAVHNVLTGKRDARSALQKLEQDLQALLGFEVETKTKPEKESGLQQESEVQAVRDVIDAEVKGTITKDIDLLQSIWASNGVIKDRAARKVYRGWRKIYARYKELFSGEIQPYTLAELSIKVTGDIATVTHKGGIINEKLYPDTGTYCLRKADTPWDWEITKLQYGSPTNFGICP